MVCQIEGFLGALDQRSDFVEKFRVSHPQGVNITGNLVGSDYSAVTVCSFRHHPLGV